jgi:inosose dehydratase
VSATRIGIAPDSWGVWNAVDPKQPDAEQYLSEVADAGYTFTELGPYGYLGLDPNQVADRIAKYGLKVSGGTVFTGLHTGTNAVDEQWAGVAEVAKMVVAQGAEHLIVLPQMWDRGETGMGEFHGKRAFTEEEWQLVTKNHNELGKRLLHEFGIKQVFHSHAESQVGSYNEVSRLIEETDEQYLNLCLDTGHFAYYYGDNVRLVQQYKQRISYLHLKQVEPDYLADVLKNDISFVEAVQNGIMVEPPYGVPEYGDILAEAAKHVPGIYAIIEQDMYPLKDFSEPKQIAIRTKTYIENLGVPVQFN